jgi:pimeloyl-ACP methyl ester carboxylesterase
MQLSKAQVSAAILYSLLLFASSATTALAQDGQEAAPACLTGAYRSRAGEIVTLTQRPGFPATLLASSFDGRIGTFETDAENAMSAAADANDRSRLAGHLRYAGCQDKPVVFQFEGGPEQQWSRLPLRITRTRFISGVLRLNGELIEPLTPVDKPPLFVLVHGSESTAAVDASNRAFLMASQGIAAFVFDKRGTGQSEGAYTQDFVKLADDVAAAVVEARRLSAGRVGRVGVAGFSQGGWVAPLAATKAPVDFMVVGYGVIGTPMEQDQWQVDYQLRNLGYGEDVVGKARSLTALAGTVAASNFRAGLPQLQQAKGKYASEPWLDKVDGQYTGELLRGEVERARGESPGVIWHYDSEAALQRLAIPQLWIFAQDDSVAPSAPSIARLERFRVSRKAIDIAVFPGSDHGIRTFTAKSDGSRKYGGYAAGYNSLMAGWMKGQPPAPDAWDKMLGAQDFR